MLVITPHRHSKVSYAPSLADLIQAFVSIIQFCLNSALPLFKHYQLGIYLSSFHSSLPGKKQTHHFVHYVCCFSGITAGHRDLNKLSISVGVGTKIPIQIPNGFSYAPVSALKPLGLFNYVALKQILQSTLLFYEISY